MVNGFGYFKQGSSCYEETCTTGQLTTKETIRDRLTRLENITSEIISSVCYLERKILTPKLAPISDNTTNPDESIEGRVNRLLDNLKEINDRLYNLQDEI